MQIGYCKLQIGRRREGEAERRGGPTMAERGGAVQTLVAIALGVAAYFGVKAWAEPLGQGPAILLAGAAAALTGFLAQGLLERLAKSRE